MLSVLSHLIAASIGAFIGMAALALLGAGYKLYGSWLEKQWGVDPEKETPALTKEDGVDYEALGNLIDWQVASGVKALVVCATTANSASAMRVSFSCMAFLRSPSAP